MLLQYGIETWPFEDEHILKSTEYGRNDAVQIQKGSLVELEVSEHSHFSHVLFS